MKALAELFTGRQRIDPADNVSAHCILVGAHRIFVSLRMTTMQCAGKSLKIGPTTWICSLATAAIISDWLSRNSDGFMTVNL